MNWFPDSLAGVFSVFLIVLAVLLVLVLDGSFTKNRLCRPKLAQRGAEITEVRKSIAGGLFSKHYEATVIFSDGTSYRGNCSRVDDRILRYDEEQQSYLEMDARRAHDRAVEKKEAAE